ncbi:MAG: NADH:flavin oxidoreductase [Proteobacteria bacterium]|nr:NADH:flavin oxidoreductase [Pseudomonadota bacterium]MBU1738506.1 NADH:flavin oxidoreductase [Pseudomonadota bacterium]
MPGLFDPIEINGLKLGNRLIRSATWEGMCETDGRPTPKLTKFYHALALGEVGLIITGYTFVSPEGKQLPGKMGIHTDTFAADYKSMVDAVHDAGGKICLQLVHAGGQTDSGNAGRKPLAPSAIASAQYPEIPAEMTADDISNVVRAFGDGARRAKEYGFDAVQLHGAHGYLINQFLSPLTNRRGDLYGGTAVNRLRFLREVYEAVRTAVTPDYPVLIKLNGSDFLAGGLDREEALSVARYLDEAGIDAIEVSGGTPASGEQTPARKKISSEEQEGYNLSLAADIKKHVTCPVFSVGGFRSLSVIEKALADHAADCFSMARPFIREPDLAKRWRLGETTKARCISCNGCFIPGIKEGGIYCVAEKKEREKAQEQ